MIYIIRHGQTELNILNVLQGRSDHPLNETGIRQAEEAAERLKGISFDAVYSSPLIRAVKTAEIIAPELKPIIIKKEDHSHRFARCHPSDDRRMVGILRKNVQR